MMICFNEATAVRPWKVGHLHCLQGQAGGFNEATAVRPWKVREDQALTQGPPGFNEATAVRPWKGHEVENIIRIETASMRPRLLGRGRPRSDLLGMRMTDASMRPRLLGRGRHPHQVVAHNVHPLQ